MRGTAGTGKEEGGSEGALWFGMWKSRGCCGDSGVRWRENEGGVAQCGEAHSR